jgi:hypothetical protein
MRIRSVAAIALVLIAVIGIVVVLSGKPAPAPAPASTGTVPPPGRGTPESDRPPLVSAKRAPEDRDAIDSAAEEIPVYFVSSEQDVVRILEAHGVGEAQIARWAFEKGMDPAGFGITFGSQGAYALYDDETLAALAQQGDAWAQQTLASRIWKERPLEAADLYRAAAARGSAEAARQLSSLYFYAADALGRQRTGDWSPETIEALRQAGEGDGGLAVSALAWALAGEAEAGLPQGSLASFLLSDYTDADLEAACERAASIVADNTDQRRQLGQAPGWQGPAPVFPDPSELTMGQCPRDILPAPDLSGCHPVRVEMDDLDSVGGERGGLTLQVCPGSG